MSEEQEQEICGQLFFGESDRRACVADPEHCADGRTDQRAGRNPGEEQGERKEMIWNIYQPKRLYYLYHLNKVLSCYQI